MSCLSRPGSGEPEPRSTSRTELADAGTAEPADTAEGREVVAVSRWATNGTVPGGTRLGRSGCRGVRPATAVAAPPPGARSSPGTGTCDGRSGPATGPGLASCVVGDSARC